MLELRSMGIRRGVLSPNTVIIKGGVSTWSCNLRFLDEFVVWKIFDDLLCDLPRVHLCPLRLQHLQPDSQRQSGLKNLKQSFLI